jgi:thiol-disulfide isomerase/thioredoxin
MKERNDLMPAILTILIFMTFVSPSVQAQAGDVKEIRVMNFDQLEPHLHFKNDTVYLVNFWASWCAPCRKEMPAIKAVAEKYSDRPFKVLLISLDIPGQLETHLKPYLESNNIDMDIVLLDDPDQNRWISLVDESWTGEIPFTLIYGKNFREAHSQVFTFEKLDTIIHSKINLP